MAADEQLAGRDLTVIASFCEETGHGVLTAVSFTSGREFSWRRRLPKKKSNIHQTSRDSSVGIALDYGLDDRGSRVRFPTGSGNFSLHHRVQNGSGTHPATYPMGTRGSFPGGKAAGAWSWPLTSSAEVKECVELYLHSPIRLHGVVLN
jgi:hypothetical protein